MSLIHQALKKLERKPTDKDSLAGVQLVQEKPVRPMGNRRRLIVLIVCNLVALVYLAWSWKPGHLSNLFHRQTPAVALVPIPPVPMFGADPTSSMNPELAAIQKRALRHYRQQEWRESRDLMQELTLKEPLNPEHYNNLGLVLRKLGRWEDALEQYRKALQLDPQYAVAHNNVGVLYLAQGDQEMAQHFLNKAIETNASYADPYLNLGFLFEMRGDLPSARRSYQAFLENLTETEDPMHAEVKKHLERLSSATQE